MEGKIIARFGKDGGGARNDGINIAADLGTPIHAAAAGTVTYAGNELKSYGNLILIKHDNGYVTAYAHAQRLAVSRGDHVDRGDVIGYAGATGDVSSPQAAFRDPAGREAGRSQASAVRFSRKLAAGCKPRLRRYSPRASAQGGRFPR